MLTRTADPAAIMTAAQAKARVASLADFSDAVVESLMAAVTAEIDATPNGHGILGRAIGQQTFDWKPEEGELIAARLPAVTIYQNWWWTDGPYVTLPMPPLISVTHFKYLDSDGVEQTFSTANYAVGGVGSRGRIALKSGSSWPTFGTYLEPITIRMVVGWATVPNDVKQWIAEEASSRAQGGTRPAGLRSETVEGVGSFSYATGQSSYAVHQSVVPPSLEKHRVFHL